MIYIWSSFKNAEKLEDRNLVEVTLTLFEHFSAPFDFYKDVSQQMKYQCVFKKGR